MCMGAFSACVFLYHMCAWHPKKPEESIESPRTGVRDGCDLELGLEPESSQKAAVLLITESSRQHTPSFLILINITGLSWVCYWLQSFSFPFTFIFIYKVWQKQSSRNKYRLKQHKPYQVKTPTPSVFTYRNLFLSLLSSSKSHTLCPSLCQTSTPLNYSLSYF